MNTKQLRNFIKSVIKETKLNEVGGLKDITEEVSNALYSSVAVATEINDSSVTVMVKDIVDSMSFELWYKHGLSKTENYSVDWSVIEPKLELAIKKYIFTEIKDRLPNNIKVK